MRLLVRMLGGISVAVVLVTAAFTYLDVRDERTRLEDDLRRRAVLAADAVKEATERLAPRGARTGYDRILTRFGRTDRGIAIYDEFASVIAATADVRPHLGPLSPLITDAIGRNATNRRFARIGGHTMWMHVVPLERDDRPIGAVAVFLDAGYLDSREWALWRRTAVQLGVLILILTLITWLLIRWTVTRPMARIAEWTKRLKSGEPVAPPPAADASLFGSLAGEVTGLARTLVRARAVAEQEARLRLLGEHVWTEERLKQFVQMRFGSRPVFVVSNREPVSHVFEGKRIVEQHPASGLVSALEPIMRGLRRACGSPTAAATPTARPASGSACRRTTRATRSVGSGSTPRRRPGTTTASPTRGCGRSATSCTSGRSSAPATGSTTGPSTSASPTPCSRRWTRRNRRSCWSRTITSRSCPA